MIDHNVMRLYISMHDATRVAEIQRLKIVVNKGIKRSRRKENLEKLEHVESDIEVSESWI